MIQAWKSNFYRLPVLTHTNNSDIPVIFSSGQPNQISSYIPVEEELSTIYLIAFLHHNTQIVSGHADGSMRIWEASNGLLLQKLLGHQGAVVSVAVTLDSKWIASGSNDMTVRIWDTHSGNLIHTLDGHTGGIKSIAVSQDGKTIVSSSRDHTIIIWNLVSGQWQSRTLTTHENIVQKVAIVCNVIYAVSWDLNIYIWEISADNLTVLHTLEGHTAQISSVSISSDGTQIASGSDDKTV